MLTEMPNQEWDIFFPLPEGRNVNWEDVQSIEQVGAEPLLTMACKSLLVAAMRRASVRSVRELPNRSNSRSCWTRRSFGCRSMGISLISSRNMVPCDASSKTPYALRDRSDERPFSCPNNSLSSTPVGIAAQFSFTNGWFRRWLRL